LPETGSKLWTANFVLICLSNVSVYLAFYCLVPTLPIYIQEYGGSERSAGLAIAFLALAAVVIRPFVGWSLDHYGRKFILISGLLIFLLPPVIYIAMIPFIAMLMLRILQGFGWGICSTAQGTVASDVIPPDRMGEGLGYFGLANSVSMATAPAIGLWVIDSFSFPVLFVVVCLLTALSTLMSLLIKYPRIKPPGTRSKLVFMEKKALPPAVTLLFVTFTYSTLLSFLALFVREKGMTTAGVFFTVMAVTTVLSRPLGGIIVDKKGRRGYDLIVTGGIVLIILAVLVLAQLSGTLHLVLGGILFGTGFGFVQPTLMSLCIRSVPVAKRGMANATYWIAFDIGVSAGSVVWGLIAKSLGFAAMFRLSAVPLIIALATYCMYYMYKTGCGSQS